MLKAQCLSGFLRTALSRDYLIRSLVLYPAELPVLPGSAAGQAGDAVLRRPGPGIEAAGHGARGLGVARAPAQRKPSLASSWPFPGPAGLTPAREVV
jgi:hypothetical protein